MDFSDFIGQEAVKRELENSIGYHVHILLRGNSGCGKTRLAEILADRIGPYDIQTVRSTSDLSFNPQAVTHILDEAHLIRQPELIFEEMTRSRFILCTTESGELAETLVNRCVVLTLQPYTLVELMQIGWQQYVYNPAVMALLASRSRETPRTMLQLCQRVQMSVPTPNYFEVKAYLEEIGVYDEGYTSDDLRYLEVLADLGRAGRDTLASALRLPVLTITREIEPFLLRRRRIQITSKGRSLL
jgi:Holliday junction resolvasome RuvABC ATP-dependent DNA helicase subunit